MSGGLPTISIARPLVSDEEKQAVLDVLGSGQLAQGARVAAFEEAFAAYVGTPHAVAVNSGTAALIVALQAHGVGAGDEVITSPFSFIATATSIIACGARPVFVDISSDDYNLDPALIGAAITPRTKAVMPVHLYGNPARIDEIGAICAARGIALVEDAAQAHGAEFQGRRVGSFGSGCFSFYPTKNMTTGEGGIITTCDGEVARLARIIRNHGQERRYYHEYFGLNWRMTDIAAAIGLVQLGRLEAWNQARIRNAEGLSARIRALGLGERLILPGPFAGNRHVYHQYTVRIPEGRDMVAQRLQELGIGTAVHYPVPINRQPIIERLGFGGAPLPVSEAMAAQVLSLPVHPSLTEADLDRVAAGLQSALRA